MTREEFWQAAYIAAMRRERCNFDDFAEYADRALREFDKRRANIEGFGPVRDNKS